MVYVIPLKAVLSAAALLGGGRALTGESGNNAIGFAQQQSHGSRLRGHRELSTGSSRTTGAPEVTSPGSAATIAAELTSSPALNTVSQFLTAKSNKNATMLFGLNEPISAGETPSCSGVERKCTGFYTFGNFGNAAMKYETLRTEQPGQFQPFLGRTTYSGVDLPSHLVPAADVLNVKAMFANAWIESDRFNACKERLQVPDATGAMHCPPEANGVCSEGHIDHYTTANAANKGWTQTTCGDKDRAAQGCTDAWGKPVADPRNCYFGQGFLQITWPYNVFHYGKAAKALGGEDSVDLCDNPDAMCADPEVALITSIFYWTDKVQESFCSRAADGRTVCKFLQTIEKINPADRRGDGNRISQWKRYLDSAGIPSHAENYPAKNDPGAWNYRPAGTDYWVYLDEVPIAAIDPVPSSAPSTTSAPENEVLEAPAYCAQNECATCIVNTSYDFTRPDAHAVTDEQCSNCISGNTANWPCNKQFHCGCTPKRAAPPAVFPPETCQRSPSACGSCGVNESTLKLKNAHLVSAEQCSECASGYTQWPCNTGSYRCECREAGGSSPHGSHSSNRDSVNASSDDVAEAAGIPAIPTASIGGAAAAAVAYRMWKKCRDEKRLARENGQPPADAARTGQAHARPAQDLEPPVSQQRLEAALGAGKNPVVQV